MANEKRDENGGEQLRLEEMTPADEAQQPPGIAPIELMMEQVSEELRSLPTAAQLSVLRAFLPELLGDLDANDRAYWARELVGEGVPEIPTLTV